MTMGRMKEYHGKQGRLPREGRKSTEDRKEVNQGKKGRLLKEQRKITKRRKKDRLPNEGSPP